MARARGSRRPRSPTPLSQVFDVAGDTTTQLAELAGHEGPVWAVAWAHPSFGTLLASASFDNRVILWREDGRGGWARSHDAPPHGASVNAVAFAPHELGLSLAAASSDGCLSVLTSPDGGLSWGRETVDGAHAGGALAVAWAPAPPAAALATSRPSPAPEARLASAGCDGAVRLWRRGEGGWVADGAPLAAHGDWVRDVAWAPPLSSPASTIASAGQDGRVYVWTEAAPGAGWAPTLIHDFGAPVWRVSWSLAGGVLAVSDGRGDVTLWRESVDGAWEQVTAPGGGR